MSGDWSSDVCSSDLANRMLAESRKSITEISICCGFNGPQAMNRVYGKVTGISPSDMRRLCQGIESGKAM